MAVTFVGASTAVSSGVLCVAFGSAKAAVGATSAMLQHNERLNFLVKALKFRLFE